MNHDLGRFWYFLLTLLLLFGVFSTCSWFTNTLECVRLLTGCRPNVSKYISSLNAPWRDFLLNYSIGLLKFWAWKKETNTIDLSFNDIFDRKSRSEIHQTKLRKNNHDNAKKYIHHYLCSRAKEWDFGILRSLKINDDCNLAMKNDETFPFAQYKKRIRWYSKRSRQNILNDFFRMITCNIFPCNQHWVWKVPSWSVEKQPLHVTQRIMMSMQSWVGGPMWIKFNKSWCSSSC